MLKIKDNVDLKELEKYGFEYKDVSEYYDYEEEKVMGYIFKNKEFSISEHREIEWLEWPECLDVDVYEDTLYDLIKDGLVEKVEE